MKRYECDIMRHDGTTNTLGVDAETAADAVTMARISGGVSARVTACRAVPTLQLPDTRMFSDIHIAWDGRGWKIVNNDWRLE